MKNAGSGSRTLAASPMVDVLLTQRRPPCEVSSGHLPDQVVEHRRWQAMTGSNGADVLVCERLSSPDVLDDKE